MSTSFHVNASENKLTFQGLSQISPIKSKSTWEKWYKKQSSFKIIEKLLHNSKALKIALGLNYTLAE